MITWIIITKIREARRIKKQKLVDYYDNYELIN